MAKRGPMTYSKRKRESDKKRTAEEKRARRAQRAKDGPVEPDIIIHRPFVDEE